MLGLNRRRVANCRCERGPARAGAGGRPGGIARAAFGDAPYYGLAAGERIEFSVQADGGQRIGSGVWADGAPGSESGIGTDDGLRSESGVEAGERDTVHDCLPRIWARLRIADLMDRRVLAADPHGELEGMIRRTALDYKLMSDYTAFVAVDASRPTAGNFGVTVAQPVRVPAGVRYETTVR